MVQPRETASAYPTILSCNFQSEHKGKGIQGFKLSIWFMGEGKRSTLTLEVVPRVGYLHEYYSAFLQYFLI
jgi:hypothetical protein